jgi:hypothetical protein
MPTAVGRFDVKTSPLSTDAPNVGRMSIDKQFHGDLTGASKGEMLAVGSPVKGSAGYVAMETVTGEIQGRTGTFSLMHTGTMNRGEMSLIITVVPDSGTGELTGLSGELKIVIEGKEHRYEMEYQLL